MTFSFGKTFRITIFGESHGVCVGVVIEGCPPGKEIDISLIQERLDSRRPGQSGITTARKELDRVEILSGLMNGKATGAPLTMMVKNVDVDSTPYERTKNTPKPGHADLTARIKYRGFHDYRGGGIFSGRMTAALVMAGAVAEQILAEKGIRISAHLTQVGTIRITHGISDGEIEENAPTESMNSLSHVIEQEIRRVKKEGDSIGGLVECRVTGVPPGIGEPFFDSVESVLSHLIFSIPGVKGIEFGSGFGAASMKGSDHNDSFFLSEKKVLTKTNNAGGILGGISNGMPLVLRVAVKPTPSIGRSQKTVDLEKMKQCEIQIRGRHDPCIAVRVVPVIGAVIGIGLTDLFMRS
jgi:chorismate synthase